MDSEVNTLDELLETIVPPGARQADPARVRRAIITGGSTGLGRYMAIALAQDNCDVAITYAHDREGAELTAQAVRHFGRACHIQQMNLETPEHAEPAVDEMVDALGGLDIFVSNAGTMTQHQMPEIDVADLQKLFNINTFGAVLGVQRALRHMLALPADPDQESSVRKTARSARKILTGHKATPRETPGRIILITSVHETVASPADTIYTMTKHALGGFVKCAAYTCAGLNVTVNALAPGEIATPMNDMHPEDALDTQRDDLPSKRAGHPTEIADAVRFLASDASSFINGMSYAVDGGMTIGEPMVMEAYRDLV